MTVGTCKFNCDEWPYCWAPRPKKFWKQSPCLICGLWTVWTDLRFGATVRLCDGFKAAQKAYADVNKRAANERLR